ncbi:hypothetical protein LTS10_006327 [Elasticomyces elasticus]|nr:hypothetical protein LTS10_006327 [Elasticomyces elasticus]
MRDSSKRCRTEPRLDSSNGTPRWAKQPPSSLELGRHNTHQAFGPAFPRQTGTTQHVELYTEEGQLEVVSARLVAAAQIFKSMEGHGITVAQLIRGFVLGSCGRHDMWLRQETMVSRYIKDKSSHIDMAPVVKKMLDKIRQSVRTDRRVPLALQLLSEAAGILSLLEETKADALRDLIADIRRWLANAV